MLIQPLSTVLLTGEVATWKVYYDQTLPLERLPDHKQLLWPLTTSGIRFTVQRHCSLGMVNFLKPIHQYKSILIIEQKYCQSMFIS